MIRQVLNIFIFIGGLFPLSGQQNWYDYYAAAAEAISNSDWQTAVDNLDKSIEIRPAPKLAAETYSLRFVDYLPYYWRGVALYNMGEHTQAAQAFKRSESWGSIRRSNLYPVMNNYVRLVGKVIARQDSLHALQNESESIRTQLRQTGDLSRNIYRFVNAVVDRDTVTAAKILETLRPEITDSGAVAALRTILENGGNNQKESTDRSRNSYQSMLFDRALDAYVTGNYETALIDFNVLARDAPEFRNVVDWLRRTRSEMQRVGLKPDTQLVEIIRRDTLTIAPIIAITSTERSVRSGSILLRGTAKDDQGIDRISISLNGKAYTAGGELPVEIRPPIGHQGNQFDFEIRLPLQEGENEAVITVYDIDAETRSAAYPVTLTRMQPVYRTPAFLLSVLAVLLIGSGAWIANTVIKRRIAFVNKYNPYIAGAPVRNPKMFFGRDILIRRIINTLHNNSLMIFGPRRIGKTSLLHQLKRRLEIESDPEFRYVPVYIDLQGTPEARLFAVMMEDIWEECESILGDDLHLQIVNGAANYTARDFSRDIKQILTRLRESSSKRAKLVLLIDEVDELNSYSARVNQKLRSIFMKTFAEDLVAVMSGSYIRKHWESEGSPWYNFFEEIRVQGIDPDWASELIRQPVKGIFEYDEAAVQKILEYSENVPYQIQKFCINAISRVIEERRRRVTVADIEAVRSKVSERVAE